MPPLDTATMISLKGSDILATRSRFVWFWTSLLCGPKINSTIYFRFSRKSTPLRTVTLLSWLPNMVKIGIKVSFLDVKHCI